MTDDQQVAQTESLFRRTNERIEDTALEWATGDPTAFLCECADPECEERIEVRLDVYERVRAHPDQFLLIPGHDRPEETVLERSDHYVVVRKRGTEADVADEENPRD